MAFLSPDLALKNGLLESFPLESYIPTQAWNFRVHLTNFISLSYLANLAKFLSDAKKLF